MLPQFLPATGFWRASEFGDIQELLRRNPIETRKALLTKLLGRRDRVSRGVQVRLRGHCVKAAWLDLSSWPFTALGKGQEPECTSGKARGRRRLEQMTQRRDASLVPRPGQLWVLYKPGSPL